MVQITLHIYSGSLTPHLLSQENEKKTLKTV